MKQEYYERTDRIEKDAKERYKTSKIIRKYSIYNRRNSGSGDRGTGSALSGKIYGRGRTSYRQQAKVKHSMKDVVGIVFFAVLAGNDEWSEIYDFALDEKETLEKYLELPNGIPSHDTIQRLFSILNGDELQSMLVNILVRLVTVAGKGLDEYLYRNEELGCCIRDMIAADGKEIRNTGNAEGHENA